MSQSANLCCFCNSSELRLLYQHLYHPFKTDHGPYNFFQCKNCGSGLTYPLPSCSELSLLYSSFNGGMIPLVRELRERYPLTSWYSRCIKDALNGYDFSEQSSFSWMDVGAGEGEMALALSAAYPQSVGYAFDFHDSPPILREKKNVHWQSKDLNQDFSYPKADIIFMITVLEHVMYPDRIINALLDTLNPGGRLYIIVPDFGSLAARILKRRWPYFIPGEHLNIPTIRGIKLLLNRICNEKFSGRRYEIHADRTIIPYAAGYYLQYFTGIKWSGLFSETPLSVPTGILQASVTLKA